MKTKSITKYLTYIHTYIYMRKPTQFYKWKLTILPCILFLTFVFLLMLRNSNQFQESFTITKNHYHCALFVQSLEDEILPPMTWVEIFAIIFKDTKDYRFLIRLFLINKKVLSLTIISHTGTSKAIVTDSTKKSPLKFWFCKVLYTVIQSWY